MSQLQIINTGFFYDPFWIVLSIFPLILVFIAIFYANSFRQE